MNIALAHFRVGETDGVSLEMDKWASIFKKNGHNVFYITGIQGSTDIKTFIIDELSYTNKKNEILLKNSFESLDDLTENELRFRIEDTAKSIKLKLKDIILKNRIDLLIPNNIWSLGYNLAAGIAFANTIEETQVSCIAHNHDFYWDREKYAHPTCSYVTGILNKYFPPLSPKINYVVINEIDKAALKKRKNKEAIVIPNVFDFSKPEWKIDEYNSDLRKKIGIKENDIMILQATRVVRRKAIELAIDLVAELNRQRIALENKELFNGRVFSKKSKIIFVLAGITEESDYMDLLKREAREKKINIKFINNFIRHTRFNSSNTKYYSLWDAYAHADIITYPSIFEGWGNQLIEGVFAKKPVIIYEYSVYKTDIKPKNFDFISLGDSHRTRKDKLAEVARENIKNAAERCIQVMQDKELRTGMVEKNYQIGKNNFSYKVLENKLSQILAELK